MSASTHERNKVFISYSHADAEWLERLRVHLKPLKHQYGLDIWDDTRIHAGSKWQEEIGKALASAKVAVLLVSANFLASDFIEQNELPPLLQAAEREGTVILPVILSASRFSRTPTLSRFQAVNDPKRPLDGRPRNEQEEALDKVAAAIEAALGYLPEPPSGVGGGVVGGSRTSAGGAGPQTNPGGRGVRRTHPAVWVAVVTGLVALAAAYWLLSKGPAPGGEFQYTGRVTDAATGAPVQNAQVSLEADQNVPLVRSTDSGGIFSVILRGPVRVARVRVEKSGYKIFERNLAPAGNGIEDIKLEGLATPTPTPTLTPTPAPTRAPIPRPTRTPLRKSGNSRCTVEDRLLGKC